MNLGMEGNEFISFSEILIPLEIDCSNDLQFLSTRNEQQVSNSVFF